MRHLILAIALLLVTVAGPTAPGAAADACDPVDLAFARLPSPPDTAAALRRHQALLRTLPAKADVVLLGDSLVEAWPPALARALDPGGSVLNLGVGRDRVQNVLWRLDEGRASLARLRPKAVVVLAGTNNLGLDPGCSIATGIRALVQTVDALWGHAKILVVEIPPRGPHGLDMNDRRVDTNAQIEAAARDAPFTTFNLDAVVACGGTTACASYLPDALHLSEDGYRLLTRPIAAALSR